MFTGIIAALGSIQAIEAKGGDVRLDVAMQQLDLSDVILGDSIAINGVCLTVVAIAGEQLSFDVSRETLERSSLGFLKTGSEVNLEKALAVGDRLGGHFVSGHVDGLAECIQRVASARSIKFRFSISVELTRYIAEKGSVCIDGTSLTVNNTGENWFEVNIIPHTLEETIIKTYQVGTKVNIEVDLIARYLERLLPEQKTSVTHETLLKNGFVK